MMSALPDPLVPADVNLRDFGYMPLDVQRLRDSELTVLATGEEFMAAVLLWCASWHQVPAASLPNDDRMLARYSGAADWKKVREMALHGFVACSDGRLYHPVIAEKALEAWGQKMARYQRASAATEARVAKRRDERDVVQRDERDVVRVANITFSTNHTKGTEGNGRERKGTDPPDPAGPPDSSLRSAHPPDPAGPPGGRARARAPPARSQPACRAPPDFVIDAAMQRWAEEHVPAVDVVAETAKFRDHEYRNPHTDWAAAWRNWMRRTTELARGPPKANVRPLNRQLAIEAENKRVAREWAAAQKRKTP